MHGPQVEEESLAKETGTLVFSFRCDSLLSLGVVAGPDVTNINEARVRLSYCQRVEGFTVSPHACLIVRLRDSFVSLSALLSLDNDAKRPPQLIVSSARSRERVPLIRRLRD